MANHFFLVVQQKTCIKLQLKASYTSRSKSRIILAARPCCGLQRRTLTLTKARYTVAVHMAAAETGSHLQGDSGMSMCSGSGTWKVESNCARLTRSHIPSFTWKVLLWRKKIAKPSETPDTIFINQTGSQKTFSGATTLGVRSFLVFELF